MRTFDRWSTFGEALENEEARRLLEAEVPDLLGSSLAEQLRGFPLGGFLEFALAADADKARSLLQQLSTIEDTRPLPVEPPAIQPDADYESVAVAHASASVTLPDKPRLHETTEIVLAGPSHGNPFVDVELGAILTHGDLTLRVGGFYDDDGSYVLRFLLPIDGEWSFVTTSNARSLDGITGSISVADSDGRGPVRVVDQFAFAYADGSPYTPFGTTAYVWTLQPEALQDETIRTLKDSPFNKLRMGLFPKDFLYNSNDPDRYVFPRREDGGWDTTRFDVDYFRRLERRIKQLGELGIEADLILFHPYDRWGFAALGKAADDRYVKYVTRRLSGFANVWWSLANEYELLVSKRPDDWDRIARVIQAEDPSHHLMSIHNWTELFDYSADWATHASIQRNEGKMSQRVDEWRHRWGKPVVVDEFGYEGNLDQGWGNLTAEEVVEKFWDGTVRGGYLTHGETFHAEDEVLWWSKGGKLAGESPARVAFLRTIVSESPTGRVEPLPSDWDARWGGVKNEYILIYFGANRPLFRNVSIPEGMRARIDVIDTWNMNIQTVPGVHEGTVHVDLPARPYMAIRLTKADQ
ncbi:DUF4038 domain-containing protein [Diaminobutyricibacter tongyongensis]|uniref:DUF4038 domain-containing protein n=2 Tax=Leifsonia tongyongensis TaxID=1268043 RepID=A0A6L9XU99_9MICO|nr:DUF4038 domain-containing protein [Diaminobutyricibacter tongyongensis]